MMLWDSLGLGTPGMREVGHSGDALGLGAAAIVSGCLLHAGRLWGTLGLHIAGILCG